MLRPVGVHVAPKHSANQTRSALQALAGSIISQSQQDEPATASATRQIEMICCQASSRRKTRLSKMDLAEGSRHAPAQTHYGSERAGTAKPTRRLTDQTCIKCRNEQCSTHLERRSRTSLDHSARNTPKGATALPIAFKELRNPCDTTRTASSHRL